MTAKEKQLLFGLQLCDLYTQHDGVRERKLWDGVDIFVVQKPGGAMFLQANVYPFRCTTRPLTQRGLQDCKDFVRRWAG